MAMDSAAALVDELSRSESDHMQYALNLYTRRQKKRVEKAQTDSRQLGKMMFVQSPLLSMVRNYALRFYTLKNLLANISKVIEGER